MYNEMPHRDQQANDLLSQLRALRTSVHALHTHIAAATPAKHAAHAKHAAPAHIVERQRKRGGFAATAPAATLTQITIRAGENKWWHDVFPQGYGSLDIEIQKGGTLQIAQDSTLHMAFDSLPMQVNGTCIVYGSLYAEQHGSTLPNAIEVGPSGIFGVQAGGGSFGSQSFAHVGCSESQIVVADGGQVTIGAKPGYTVDWDVAQTTFMGDNSKMTVSIPLNQVNDPHIYFNDKSCCSGCTTNGVKITGCGCTPAPDLGPGVGPAAPSSCSSGPCPPCSA